MHASSVVGVVLLTCSVGAGACAGAPIGGRPTAADREPAPAASVAPPLPIPNAAQPLPDVLTGGQPTAEHLELAKRSGYRTVISLLPQEQTREEAAQVAALGMRFVSIPVAGPADLTRENARRLAAAMQDAQGAPLIVHCGSGNRAGALLALRLFYVDGVPREDALAVGTKAGMTSLRSAVEQRMAP